MKNLPVPQSGNKTAGERYGSLFPPQLALCAVSCGCSLRCEQAREGAAALVPSDWTCHVGKCCFAWERSWRLQTFGAYGFSCPELRSLSVSGSQSELKQCLGLKCSCSVSSERLILCSSLKWLNYLVSEAETRTWASWGAGLCHPPAGSAGLSAGQTLALRSYPLGIDSHSCSVGWASPQTSGATGTKI